MEQHGSGKGHSTASLVHILEAVLHTAVTTQREVVVVQIDVAKAFDKIHTEALAKPARNVIQPRAPEAAAFFGVYDNDAGILRHGRASMSIALKSGIRQRDAPSTALFSALLGLVIKPRIQKWKPDGSGGSLDPSDIDDKITVLAYADDIAMFAATTQQAGRMLEDLAGALRGINLKLLPQKCNALWSKAPEGTERTRIQSEEARIAIASSFVILGHEMAFRSSSEHCFHHRLTQAWKTAHANSTLLRSAIVSFAERLRLLQAQARPCFLYGAEVWKLTPLILGTYILRTESSRDGALSSGLRPHINHGEDNIDANMGACGQRRRTSARAIATINAKNKSERWHQAALRLH